MIRRVGFEPTRSKTPELEAGPLDLSGNGVMGDASSDRCRDSTKLNRTARAHTHTRASLDEPRHTTTHPTAHGPESRAAHVVDGRGTAVVVNRRPQCLRWGGREEEKVS